MTDIALGSIHTFIRLGVRQQFRRIPDGWSDERGVLWDDVSLADAGWKRIDPT